jgi:SAM-dependent methyltransferase
MGLERNGAALLLKMHSAGVKFGRMLTLGRQNIYLDLSDYARAFQRVGRAPPRSVPEYADDFFLAIGATQVETLDFSSYEGASLVHDLNQPVPVEWHQQFDVVFDGGTLEHVFNFPVAIKNCMEMLRPQGRFVAVTMPNNWCGHGFYQFSPELFYRVFSPANGFSNVEMYITEMDGRAYAVKDPETVKARIELCNSRQVLLLVHARRDMCCSVFTEPPQQSDYLLTWSTPRPHSGNRWFSRWKHYPVFQPLRSIRRRLAGYRALKANSLGNRRFYSPVDLRI